VQVEIEVTGKVTTQFLLSSLVFSIDDHVVRDHLLPSFVIRFLIWLGGG